MIRGRQKAFVAGGSAGILQPLFMWLYMGVVNMPYEAAMAAAIASSSLISGILTYLVPNR